MSGKTTEIGQFWQEILLQAGEGAYEGQDPYCATYRCVLRTHQAMHRDIRTGSWLSKPHGRGRTDVARRAAPRPRIRRTFRRRGLRIRRTRRRRIAIKFLKIIKFQIQELVVIVGQEFCSGRSRYFPARFQPVKHSRRIQGAAYADADLLTRPIDIDSIILVSVR